MTLEKATELGVWLHTEFQCKMEEATELMNQPAKDETKPFDEKYKARDILQNLRQNEYLSDKYAKLFDQVSAENVSENDSVSQTQSSDVMRCALGIVMHKLGINFYDSEEATESLAHLKKSFDLMDSLPDQLKLRHMNLIQDLFNHLGIILSDRDKSDEAFGYLQRA